MAQADTIVPGGVQGLDRYAYVNNSPLNYVDPSGHLGCHTNYQCRQRAIKKANAIDYKKEMEENYGWTFDGTWTNDELKVIYQIALQIEAAVGGAGIMKKMFGSVLFDKADLADGGQGGAHHVTLNKDASAWDAWSVAHELGHAWDAANNWDLSKSFQAYVHSEYPRRSYSWKKGFYMDYGSSGDGPGATGWPVECPATPTRCDDWDTWDELSGWNRVEDFAQSFAAYVDPATALKKFATYGINSYGSAYSGFRDTPRGVFVASMIPDYWSQ